MSRWVLLTITALLSLPALAHAASWSLSSRVSTGGGTLQVRDYAAQTSATGTVFKSYTTSQNVPVRVAASTGYKINGITVNNAALPLPAPDPINMGLKAYPGIYAQNITVSFAKFYVQVAATASTNDGSVSPYGTYQLQWGAPATFTFTPNGSLYVISISGLPPDATLTSKATGAPVTLPYQGAVKVTFTVPQTPVTMVGNFVGIKATTGAPQTAYTGTKITLTGSATVYDGSSGVTYAWTQLSGPQQLTLNRADTTTPDFTATVAGTYNFQFRATDSKGATSTATTYVTLTASTASAARSQCEDCHSHSGVGAASNVFYKWSSSRHKVEAVICANCHVGADVGSHPGNDAVTGVSATTFTYPDGTNFCVRCHSPNIVSEFAASRHGNAIACSLCHGDPHAALAFSTASFKTFRDGSYAGPVLCFNCHGAENSTHFYSRSAVDNLCSSCHSTTHNPVATLSATVGQNHFNGYTSPANPSYRSAYVTPRTTCTSCHLDPATGWDAYNAKRAQWGASGHGDTGSAAWKNGAARTWTQANVCVRCHSAEGYSRFVASGFQSAQALTEYSDKASEPLTCNACHLSQFQVKPVPQYTMQYRYSSALSGRTASHDFSFASSGSNLCIPCHTYLVSGENLKGIDANIASGRAPQDFWNRTPFIGPHDNGGAANVFGAAGYHFAGQTYQDGANHSGVAATGRGPCLGCHMDSADHSFQGRSNALCSSCHGSAMSDSVLTTQRSQLAAMKSALQMQLSSVRGIKYNRSVYGFFFTGQGSASGNGTLVTNWGDRDTMGAAFNLFLVDHDPGAFAHNPSYARRLLRDSIDFIANGSVDRSRDVLAGILGELQQDGMDAATIDLLRDALSVNGSSGTGYCVNCHAPMPYGNSVFGNNTAHFSQKSGYASYTNIYDCSACHSQHTPGSPIPLPAEPYGSFAREGHAAYRSAAWNGSQTVSAGGDEVNAGTGACAKCHNPAVMQAFATSDAAHPVYTRTTASSRNSVLSCATCHSSLDTASNSAVVAKLAPVRSYYNLSSAAAGFAAKVKASHSYPEAANSNVCVVCHSGTASGETVAALSARFGNLSSYTGPAPQAHALPAALTLYGNAYNGTGYAPPMLAHDRVGIAADGSGPGPCAACHNLSNESHSFAAVTKDDDGSIRSITNQSLCAGCHNTTLDATSINASRSNFSNSVAVLAQLLINKGYITSYRYGEGIPRPDLSGAWGSSAKFGAWFNIDLLTSQDAAAYVHNPAYARRVIADAIDVFDDGKMNGSAANTIASLSIDAARIADIPAGSTPASIKESATGYLGTDRAGCNSCHKDSVDPQTGHNIVEDYGASRHGSAASGPSCASCHAPNPAVAHPGGGMYTTMADLSARCAECHKPHTWRSIGICTECHNGHAPQNAALGYPHMGNYSTAQYIATRFTCDNCHVENDGTGTLTFQVYSANTQWAASGKGNVKSASYLARDFKALGTAGASPDQSAATDCVRCHTNTGYINYVSSGFKDISAWGISGELEGGDRTREMLSCPTCHNPTPFFSGPRYDEENDSIIPPYSRRKLPQVPVYYNYSSSETGRILSSGTISLNAGSSNNCIVCHSGRMSGTALKKIPNRVGGWSAPFFSNAPFMEPHGMGAAGILYQTTGYTFTHMLKDYTAPSQGHLGIGGFEEGPCVACHMLTDQPHSFAAVQHDADGTITKINAFQQFCFSCHDRSSAITALNNPAVLDGKRLQYRASLNALAAMLAAKGIYFNAERAPYFFTDSDAAKQGAATEYRNWNALNNGTVYTGLDTMGTAFNLKLLWSDVGAYAHNDYYAKRLMYDSIDYLDDGVLNGSVNTTLPKLKDQNLGPYALSDADAGRADAYIGVRP